MDALKILSVASLFLAGLLAVKGQIQEDFDCSNYNPASSPCTLDAIPFCLNNGTVITGRCHAQRAVCVDKATIDKSFDACDGHQRRSDFDCTQYNPSLCSRDAIPFCLTNGTIISGRCYAMRAVCVEQATVDKTFAACGNRRQSDFDCSQYNPMRCPRDAIPFCLHNGTIVRGSCLARRAMCVENQQIDEDFAACNKGRTGDNAATFTSASVPLLLMLFISTLL